MRAIVHPDIHHFAFWYLHGNILKRRDKVQFLQYLFVLLHVSVTLGGALVIVESDAWRNDVDHRKAAMGDSGLEDDIELFLIAAEGAGDKGGAPFHSQSAAIEGREVVGSPGFQSRAQILGVV